MGVREESVDEAHPLFAKRIGIPIYIEDELTNMCRLAQEWDGFTKPIEAYRAMVEREVWRLGLERMREIYG